jgi:hypothetical protein
MEFFLMIVTQAKEKRMGPEGTPFLLFYVLIALALALAA